MDSITKLRGKLAEAEDILQYVSKELEGYSTKDAEEHLNFAELKLRGEQYSFYEHPLTDKPFRDDYLALMIYLISLGGKKEEGWTVLYRIAAGCDYQGELQNLTTDAMTFTEERLSDLIREIYSAELANTFAIDSLMISHHMGADDAQLKFLAGVYELLKLDKGFLTEAMEFVKVLDATYWDNPAGKSKPWTILTAKDIATYIGGTPAESFSEAANLKKNRVIILNATHTGSNVLLLDDWKPNEILFLNCRFENCGGIYSANKVVKFTECLFDSNTIRFADSHKYSYAVFYNWTDKKYSAYRGFLHFNNAEFINCAFKNFKDAVPMMYLRAGSIQKCIFENCKQSVGSSMLLNVNNATINKTKFLSCRSDTNTYGPGNGYGSYNKVGNTCMIYSSNSCFTENEFSNCSSTMYIQHLKYGSCFFLLLDKGSSCVKCTFENINISGYVYHDHHDHKASAFVIGLRESTVENNEGKISIANVSNIPKEIFYVGDKEHED